MEGPIQPTINYFGIPCGECEIDLSKGDGNIDESVGLSIEDHKTPLSEKEGISEEIVNDALNDVG